MIRTNFPPVAERRDAANFLKGGDGAEKAGSRWNSSQVYRRMGADWRVVHVHWGFTRRPGVLQGLAV